MMRSLTLKLTLAFLVVGLTGAVLVALFVGQRTQTEFSRFVLDRGQTDLVEGLLDYYERNGSWSGLEAIAIRSPMQHYGREFVRAPVVLAKPDGEVVIGNRRYRPGQLLSIQDMEKTIPIEIEGEIVGLVLFTSPTGSLPLQESPESIFLRRVNQAILLGALGATLVALLLGLLLASTISRPVRALTEATQRIARGELGLQVEVRSKDEVGVLGESFNQMSSDLARSSELRRQMTADIAHDLRTPLSVILGYTEALADNKLHGSPVIYGVMHEEARHLQHLIDDLRTLSLADAGELSLERIPTSPLELLERVASTHAASAAERGISVRVQADTAIPNINVDPDRMVQVLNNLVANALRFTQQGGVITLAARAKGDKVNLLVQDDGAGIKPEDLPNIFVRFYRGDEVRNVEAGESGLGLAISKSLVETHGGKISVESELGTGTTFTIVLDAVK